MRKLFSTFPGEWFGLGLLLLRVATAVTLILQGAAYVTELRTLQIGTWVVCLITLGSGVSLLAGFVTPIASVLAVVVEVGVRFLWLPAAGWNFFNGNPLSLDVIAMALASAFLGLQRSPWTLICSAAAELSFLALHSRRNRNSSPEDSYIESASSEDSRIVGNDQHHPVRDHAPDHASSP